jgi:hypothetical protein
MHGTKPQQCSTKQGHVKGGCCQCGLQTGHAKDVAQRGRACNIKRQVYTGNTSAAVGAHIKHERVCSSGGVAVSVACRPGTLKTVLSVAEPT